MPRASIYLPRLLDAAGHGNCTVAQVAELFGITPARALSVLRYWERTGYIEAEYRRVGERGYPPAVGRLRARYVLTSRGTNALAGIRHDEAVAVTDALGVVDAQDIGAALRRRMDQQQQE